MSHTHSHARSHSSSSIRTAFLLNLGFTILEIFGGLYTNSLAILSDAVHDFGDSLSLGIAWFFEHLSQTDPDHKFSYGYRRFSLLSALLNALILFGGSVYMLSQAAKRILHPEASQAEGMILFALVGILVNGAAAFRLKHEISLNARVVALHLLEDVLGWAAVLVVGVILLFSDNPYLDPVLSILIALYILYNVQKNLRQTVKIFLQAVPAGLSIEDIQERVLPVENVQSIHHPHIWSLDGEHHVLTMHVVVPEDTTIEKARCVKNDIKRALAPLDISHLTIEIEYGEADCTMAS
ncbi:MAG: cation transporter [Anaerolineales bacterium]|nr:cation transporter [Anaerolineales bacterium]